MAWVPGEMGRQPVSRINQSRRTPCQLISSIKYCVSFVEACEEVDDNKHNDSIPSENVFHSM